MHFQIYWESYKYLQTSDPNANQSRAGWSILFIIGKEGFDIHRFCLLLDM